MSADLIHSANRTHSPLAVLAPGELEDTKQTSAGDMHSRGRTPVCPSSHSLAIAG